MSVTVSAVTGPGPFKDFLRIPSLIHHGDPNWVPPLAAEVRRTLDTRRNPYFRNADLRLLVAYRGKTPAGRMSLVCNELEARALGRRSVMFGFFETVDDGEVVRELVAEAERYARGRGAAFLEGPFNPNHYSELGLQLDSFGAPPSFFTPYNPEYYNRRLEEAGFRVSARFRTMRNDRIRRYLLDRYGPPGGESPGRNGFSARSLEPGDLDNELERIREVNNDAFASNWRFLPLDRDEYRFSAKYLHLVTRPDLIKIVEHDGRPVAILHCVLDINPLLRNLGGRVDPIKYLRFLRDRRRIKTLIIFTVAIKKAYQHTMVYRTLHTAFLRLAQGFDVLETTWLSPDNIPAVRAAEGLGLKPDKEFGVFSKEVET